MRRTLLTHLLKLSKMTVQQKTEKYFVGLYGPEEIAIENPTPPPSLYEAVKAFGEIQRLDLDSDWEVYDDCFLSYIRRRNIRLNDKFTEETLCHYFNAKLVKFERFVEFFEKYTHTYFNPEA
jgi:hypothetical protein